MQNTIRIPDRDKPIKTEIEIRGARIEILATAGTGLHSIIVDSESLNGEKFIGNVTVDELDRLSIKTCYVYPLFHFAFVSALLLADEAKVVAAYRSIRAPKRNL